MALEIVKRLNAADIAAWRRGRDIATSASGPETTEPERPAVNEVWKREYVKPLSAKETRDALFEPIWEHMTSDRDAYAAAIDWMRRRSPGSAHRTDAELAEFLKDYTRNAVQQNLGERGLLSSRPLDGIYT